MDGLYVSVDHNHHGVSASQIAEDSFVVQVWMKQGLPKQNNYRMHNGQKAEYAE